MAICSTMYSACATFLHVYSMISITYIIHTVPSTSHCTIVMQISLHYQFLGHIVSCL